MTAITRGTLGHWITRNGFLLIVIALFLFFSTVTQHFASVANVLAMAHTMAPLVIIASGMALVVFTGKLDISVGSIAFLSSAIAVLLMHDAGVGAPLAFLAALVTGALLGAFNGFVVVVLGINPLIATLGSMIALRGVAIQLTNAILIPLPESVRGLGNATIGGVFVDVIIAAVILLVVRVVHRRTVFGRRLDAIGNGEETAVRIGIPVPQTVLLSFVASGFLASVGGLIGLLQVGAIRERWQMGEAGDPNHVWIASQDVFPEAVKAMQGGDVDVGTSYDAYAHAKEAIRQAVLIAKGDKPDCPNAIVLSKAGS